MRKIEAMALVVSVLAVAVHAGVFLDDFSSDTSASYIGTDTFGSGGSFNISGGTLNVDPGNGNTHNVFYKDALLAPGGFVRVTVPYGTENDFFLTISTTTRQPGTGSEDGIRFNLGSSGTFQSRPYHNGSIGTVIHYTEHPMEWTADMSLYLFRDTETSYRVGYDTGGGVTAMGNSITLPGTAGVAALYVGVEAYTGGIRQFDNLEVQNTVGFPFITSFTASPSSLEEPGNTTLSWSTDNADSTTLNGEAVSGTSAIRFVSESTNFTLVATGSDGATVSRTVSVNLGKMFSIAVLADPQYTTVVPDGGRQYSQGLPRLEHAVAEYNQRNLDWGIVLGDMIDREIVGTELDWTHTDRMVAAWKELNVPNYYCLGNHEFSVSTVTVDGMKKPYYVYEKYGFDQKAYYGFRHKGFRFITLIGDWRYPDYDPSLPEYTIAKNYYDDLSGAANWNSAVSLKQRAWLMDLLDESLALNEPVVCMCHDPIHNYMMFNSQEMLDILDGYPNVVMWINGHHHSGGYAKLENDRHHLNLPGLVEGADRWYQLDFTPDAITTYRAENTTTPERTMRIGRPAPTLAAPSGFAVAEASGNAVLSWDTEPSGTTFVLIERRHVTQIEVELPSTAQTLAWQIIATVAPTQSHTDNPPLDVGEYKYRIRFLGGAEGSRHSQALTVGESEKDVPYVELGEEAQQFDSTSGAPMTCTLSYGSNTLYGMSILMNRELGGEWITLSEDVDYKITATESWTPEGSSQPLTRATLELLNSSSFLLAGDEPIFIKAVFNLPVE